MSSEHLRFAPYEETVDVPNVVVDGSPNRSTVVVVSHWPGMPTPPGCEADTSAEMVFRYLDRGADLHDGAEVVTNNHFDQDGLASICALTAPELAMSHRARLEGLASAGDFAVAVDRQAARLSMAVAALGDPSRSPVGPLPEDHGKACGVLYEAALARLPSWLEDVDSCRALWVDEDAALDAGLRALDSGAVHIEEDPDLDVAVVTLDDANTTSGHRFVGHRFDGIHPMALHGATERTTIVVLDRHGGRHRVTCRYEGWVQFRSRTVRPRVDLRPLAEKLDRAETDGVRWTATPPGDLSPQLRTPEPGPPSSLDPAAFLAFVTEHLRTAPPAWDPYAAASG